MFGDHASFAADNASQAEDDVERVLVRGGEELGNND